MLKALALAAAAMLTATAWPASADTPTWSYAGKTGVGTSYAPYGPDRARSSIWFSIARGQLTEVMYGDIHEAQIQGLRIVARTADGQLIDLSNAAGEIAYLDVDAHGRPLAPAYRLTTRDPASGLVIEQRIFTDPRRNSLFLRVIVRAGAKAVTPLVVLDPRVGGVALDNHAEASRRLLRAHRGEVHLALAADADFAAASADVASAKLEVSHSLEAQGVVHLIGALPTVRPGQTVTRDFALGFGASAADSAAAAKATLQDGYERTLARFEGRGGEPGWETYIRSLSQLPRVAAAAEDGGKLAYASALVLKTHEDKRHQGALIASLSTPWGDTVAANAPATGYKGVWPRDFYQCAMALAALGDRQTPVKALDYLRTVQVRADTPGAAGAVGWFQQKSHVDGKAEWSAVQMDQTAMPIMLAWKLHRLGLIDDQHLAGLWTGMLKPAADFLVDGGTVGLDWNHAKITPPATQQERWEEQSGYSPSTMAAEVTGLAAAADIARRFDAAAAARYAAASRRYDEALEARTFTTSGPLGDGHYYLRISPTGDPNDHALTEARNGRTPQAAASMLDAGFLELVRYGVRRADDPYIVASLKLIDDQSLPSDLRVRYDFADPKGGPAAPGFRRYGGDGYGEDEVLGANYAANNGMSSEHQRGRVWPIFTGERGHYALALAGLSGQPKVADLDAVRRVYVQGMERFANRGLMLPEQVFDGVGAPIEGRPAPGQGTGSATPLAWAHAEYVKLLRSVADGAVFDAYPVVQDRRQP